MANAAASLRTTSENVQPTLKGLDTDQILDTIGSWAKDLDLPLLEKVHEPVATNPDQRLATLAQQRGWRILNLFE